MSRYDDWATGGYGERQFHPVHFGDPVAVVGDGDVYCYPCACKQYGRSTIDAAFYGDARPTGREGNELAVLLVGQDVAMGEPDKLSHCSVCGDPLLDEGE